MVKKEEHGWDWMGLGQFCLSLDCKEILLEESMLCIIANSDMIVIAEYTSSWEEMSLGSFPSYTAEEMITIHSTL